MQPNDETTDFYWPATGCLTEQGAGGERERPVEQLKKSKAPALFDGLRRWQGTLPAEFLTLS